MQRRDFLKAGAVGAGGLLVSSSIWNRVLGAPANDAPYGASSFGALGPADQAGLQLPDGFVGREIARANTPVRGANGLPVGAPGYVFPVFPDGAHAFEAAGGGWILVINSENPPGADFPFLEDVQDQFGGASAIHFNDDGDVVDAYRVLSGTRTNCGGGHTPWGTWLSGEEFDETEHVPGNAPPPFKQNPGEAGRIWECDPKGVDPAEPRDELGHFKHEAAAFDDLGRVYLTEDTGDGCLYRFTPSANPGFPGSLNAGTLEALKVTGTATTWVGPIDPVATTTSTRFEAAGLEATTFNGGEGCWFAPHGGSNPGGIVYFTTKGDGRVWAYDTAASTIEVVYPGPLVNLNNPALDGVDNIIVSPHTGKVYVAEDGGDMEVIVIEDRPDLDGGRYAAPVVRLTGAQQGLVNQPNPTPVPLESEVTGITLSPDGSRLYFGSQREFVLGATYEVQAPTGVKF